MRADVAMQKSLSLVRPAFAVFTTVPWNHTTKWYQSDLLECHDGTIEIEKLGVVIIIALSVGY
jgi:hypothetical protein